MRLAVTLAAVVISVCYLAALARVASVGPLTHLDFIEHMLLLGACGVAFAAAWIVFVIAILKAGGGEPRRPRTYALVYVAVGALVLVAIVGGAPRRVAFAYSRDAFDDLAKSLASSPRVRPTMPLRAGLYSIDEYAVDAQGGMYFRVGSSSLVDVTSWGYCINPHPKRSPFGGSGYETTPVGGGWYWFEANDDW